MGLIENRVRFPSGSRNVATSAEGQCPLLMLHGVTRRWQTFLPVVDALAVCYQLHALEFRGHGKSDRTPGRYRVIDYAEDAVHYLDNHLSSPAIIYGHSLGSMVAAIVAAERSERVAALVLEDPPFHTMGSRIGESVLLSLFTEFQKLAGEDRSVAEIARMLADVQLVDPRLEQTIRLGDLRNQAALRFTASCLKRLDPQVLDSIVAGEWLEGFEIQAVMQSVKCPVLLLQADVSAGGMLTDEDVADLKVWVEDLVHVKVPGCDHQIHWNRTAELLSSVHAFLGALEV